MEVEFRPDGKLRYANNSRYKNDTMIRKEVYEDDSNWPEPDEQGRQELEIVQGDDHVSFATTKLGSMVQVQSSKDPEGLKNFYHLVQDVKCMALTLINAHFKVQPI
eukprot:jgi/Picre1/31209/NNA_006563.t1